MLVGTSVPGRVSHTRQAKG